MTDREKKFLPYFIYRPSMYIGEANKCSIVCFIYGLEFGQFICEGKSETESFSSILSKLLEEQYKIKKFATGWSNQVERYAEKNEITFSDAFFELAKLIFPNPPKPADYY